MKARLLLLASILSLVPSCADTGRQQLLETILGERAGYIDEKTRHAIVEGILRGESQHGVDALLLLAVVEHESHFRVRAHSRKDALGLMQVRADTARAVAERHGIEWKDLEDLHDPVVNISIGAAYLAELKRTFGSWNLALAAYLNGPTSVSKAMASGREVRSRYAKEILGRYRRLEDLYGSGRDAN